MESRWWIVYKAVSTLSRSTSLPPFDSFAVYSLTKAPGGGGYGGIAECDGEDLSASNYPPAHFRRQMPRMSFGIVAQANHAEDMLTLFREV